MGEDPGEDVEGQAAKLDRNWNRRDYLSSPAMVGSLAVD